MRRTELTRCLRVVAAHLMRGEASAALQMTRQLDRALVTPRPPVVDQAQMELDPHWPMQVVVVGCPLGRGVCVAQCLARQRAGDKRAPKAGRSLDLARHDGKRGTAPEAPHCVTARCECGAGIRKAYASDSAGSDKGRRRSA